MRMISRSWQELWQKIFNKSSAKKPSQSFIFCTVRFRSAPSWCRMAPIAAFRRMRTTAAHAKKIDLIENGSDHFTARAAPSCSSYSFPARPVICRGYSCKDIRGLSLLIAPVCHAKSGRSGRPAQQKIPARVQRPFGSPPSQVPALTPPMHPASCQTGSCGRTSG